MKLGIMQPYFFPYIGYWQLINAVDEFILADITQFSKQSWVARNRILKPQEGWQYVLVPLVKHNLGSLIREIEIKKGYNWEETIIRQLSHYKKRAPYYFSTMDLLAEIFSIKCDTISQFNYISVSKICYFLGISTKITRINDLKLNIKKNNAPDEWAINVCKEYAEVEEYWNPEGGFTFYDKQKYVDNNIKIRFIKSRNTIYNQERDLFEPFLSIIDIMMFNSTKEIKQMLLEYDLL